MTDVAANALGGIITAVVLALAALGWRWRKHKILKELTEIMGQAIEHRNMVGGQTFTLPDETDKHEWVLKAESIRASAVKKANELSSTAGSLVEWLDRVEPWPANSEVARQASMLSKTIERIRELLERNS